MKMGGGWGGDTIVPQGMGYQGQYLVVMLIPGKEVNSTYNIISIWEDSWGGEGKKLK